MQLWDGAVVHEDEVGLLDASAEVLLIGVGGGHFVPRYVKGTNC